eukprot:5529544-Pyramimonas_sp.AAC.1
MRHVWKQAQNTTRSVGDGLRAGLRPLLLGDVVLELEGVLASRSKLAYCLTPSRAKLAGAV